MIETDVLIIGSGIGGLSTAIKIAEARPDLSITVLTKTVEGESNTRYAQGGRRHRRLDVSADLQARPGRLMHRGRRAPSVR